MKNEERIMCSAIWYKTTETYASQPLNINNGFVVCGYRHYNCFGTLSATLGRQKYNKSLCDQGFLTSHNRFLGRYDAKQLAINAGQLSPNHKGILFSEDLW